jgi:hypothetical protein
MNTVMLKLSSVSCCRRLSVFQETLLPLTSSIFTSPWRWRHPRSSETLISYSNATRYHNPEDLGLNLHRRENLKILHSNALSLFVKDRKFRLSELLLAYQDGLCSMQFVNFRLMTRTYLRLQYSGVLCNPNSWLNAYLAFMMHILFSWTRLWGPSHVGLVIVSITD